MGWYMMGRGVSCGVRLVSSGNSAVFSGRFFLVWRLCTAVLWLLQAAQGLKEQAAQ